MSLSTIHLTLRKHTTNALLRGVSRRRYVSLSRYSEHPPAAALLSIAAKRGRRNLDHVAHFHIGSQLKLDVLMGPVHLVNSA